MQECGLESAGLRQRRDIQALSEAEADPRFKRRPAGRGRRTVAPERESVARQRPAGRKTSETKATEERRARMTYKRGKWYWMDATVNGVRYREPLETKNWQEALRKEKEKLAEISTGKLTRGAGPRQPFDTALDGYLEYQKLHTAERTYATDREKGRRLRAFFGATGRSVQLRRITADMITE